jgi:drug/metabolite transporter (DMT)-like permease
MPSTVRTLRTSGGSNSAAFGFVEWSLLAVVSLIWGSSFLWIAIGLDALHPGVIALLRTVLGAAAVWAFPQSRMPVAARAWPALVVISITGTAGPALLFAFAEQRVESSVAGMVNSATPVLVLGLSVAMLRRSPGRVQVLGLILGCAGGVLLAAPNVTGADAQPLGVALVLIAITGYAISSNLIPPLAQEYGSAPVIARALALSSVLLAPYGLLTLGDSHFEWGPVVAIVILGVLGTGFARTLYAMLLARAGAPRASMVGYFVPVVAIVLGVAVRDESVSLVEVLGLAVVLVAASMISRAERTG